MDIDLAWPEKTHCFISAIKMTAKSNQGHRCELGDVNYWHLGSDFGLIISEKVDWIELILMLRWRYDSRTETHSSRMGMEMRFAWWKDEVTLKVSVNWALTCVGRDGIGVDVASRTSGVSHANLTAAHHKSSNITISQTLPLTSF